MKSVVIAVFFLSVMTPLSQAADIQSMVETIVAPITGEGKPIFGCSIGVIHRGNVSFHQFGRIRDEDDQLPTEKTLYEVASVTKLFTGVLLADMINRGEVSLDTRLVELLPNMESLPEKVKTDLDSITLRQIATHRSGLPRLAPNFWATAGLIRENPYQIFTVEKVFAALADWRSTDNDEKKYEYSNYGYALLGNSLAHKMGIPYEELLQQRVLTPLGMTSTVFHRSTQFQLAQPHNAAGKPSKNWDLAGFAPGGGLLSTTEDMVKFAKIALDVPKTDMKTGTVYSVTSAIKLAMQIQADDMLNRQIGLGWNYNPVKKWYWHAGATGGYSSMFLLDTEGGNAVVLLSNSANQASASAAVSIITALRTLESTPEAAQKIEVVSTIEAENQKNMAMTWLDIADQTDRQFLVDKEDGQYLGHPTTVLLDDGQTILCVYPKGHGRGAIVYKRSTDGGKTWSDRLPTPENWSTSLEVPTLHRVVDEEGKKRIIMFSGMYPARMAVSEDEGETWSPLTKVGDWGGVVVMGDVIDLKTGPGHYMAMFHDNGRFFSAQRQVENPVVLTLFQTLSTDGGRTWARPEVVWKGSDIHLCEPGMVRSPDGKEIAVLLRENSRRANSHIMFTQDEGKTWTTPIPMPAVLNGDRHTLRYTKDGRLFVSFRDISPKEGEPSPTWGDWVAWVGTYDDLKKGRDGQYRVRLMDNTKSSDCAYPGVLVLPDDTIVTTTYGHWTKDQPPYIMTVRLKLAELDAMMTP